MTHPNDSYLARVLKDHPHRWNAEAVELARVLAAVEDMSPAGWRKWLDELSACLVGGPVPSLRRASQAGAHRSRPMGYA